MKSIMLSIGLLVAGAAMGCASSKCKIHPTAPSETRTISLNDKVPDGWIPIGAKYDPAFGPKCRRNAWVIGRYDDRRLGDALDVFNASLPPKGWVVLGYRHTGKFQPGDYFEDDTKTIQRIE